MLRDVRQVRAQLGLAHRAQRRIPDEQARHPDDVEIQPRPDERVSAAVDRHELVRATRAAAGWSVLDAEHALFTAAIRLSIDRGDKAGAFAFAERSHGAHTTIPDLQHRLAGSGTAVLEFAALPPEQIPTIVALAPHLRDTRRRGGFEYGLDTLLAGLNATNSDTAPAW